MNASNIEIVPTPKHKRCNVRQCAWLEVDKNIFGNAIVSVDDYEKEYFKHLELKPGESLFRVVTSVSIQELIIKINRNTGQVFFLKDYDDEDSGWKRGKKFYKLHVHDVEDFEKNFVK